MSTGEVLARVCHACMPCPLLKPDPWDQWPFSIHTHSVISVIFLFTNPRHCPSPTPPPPAFGGIGDLLASLLLFVLRWSMDVFQKKVILYDLSWNLF